MANLDSIASAERYRAMSRTYALGKAQAESGKVPRGDALGAIREFLIAHGVHPSGFTHLDYVAAIQDYKKIPHSHMPKKARRQFLAQFLKEVYAIPISPKPASPAERSKPRKSPAQIKPQRQKPPAAQLDRSAFYFSEEWRRTRYVALKRSRGVCELCGIGPTPGHPLHVDHIKPRSKYPQFELDVDNLQILCEDCNLGKSNCDEIDWRRPA